MIWTRPRCDRSRAVRAALACVALAASACGDGPTAEQGGLAPEEFVAVVVELREIERDLADSDSAAAEFERRKTEVLDRYGTSEERLRAFVERHGTDLELMHSVWDSISRRLRHVPWPDSPAVHTEGTERSERPGAGAASDSTTAPAHGPTTRPDSVRAPRTRRLLVERPDSVS